MISRARLLVFFWLVMSGAVPVWAADPAPGSVGSPAGIQRVLGVVENGKFVALAPAIAGLRLTTIQRHEARSVE